MQPMLHDDLDLKAGINPELQGHKRLTVRMHMEWKPALTRPTSRFISTALTKQTLTMYRVQLKEVINKYKVLGSHLFQRC